MKATEIYGDKIITEFDVRKAKTKRDQFIPLAFQNLKQKMDPQMGYNKRAAFASVAHEMGLDHADQRDLIEYIKTHVHELSENKVPLKFRSLPTNELQKEMTKARTEGRLIWRTMKAELDSRANNEGVDEAFGRKGAEPTGIGVPKMPGAAPAFGKRASADPTPEQVNSAIEAYTRTIDWMGPNNREQAIQTAAEETGLPANVVAKIINSKKLGTYQARKFESVSKKKHLTTEQAGELPPPIPGLEGPWRMRNGRVVYYDPKEGEYYDRGRDMYLSPEEAQDLHFREMDEVSGVGAVVQGVNTTADVKPGETRRQAAKLGLLLDKGNRPPYVGDIKKTFAKRKKR